VDFGKVKGMGEAVEFVCIRIFVPGGVSKLGGESRKGDEEAGFRIVLLGMLVVVKHESYTKRRW
jgi:hypothetical protein